MHSKPNPRKHYRVLASDVTSSLLVLLIGWQQLVESDIVIPTADSSTVPSYDTSSGSPGEPGQKTEVCTSWNKLWSVQ